MIAEKQYTAVIDTNDSGDNSIISAPGTGKFLAIDFITFLPTTAVTAKIISGSTDKSGPLPLDAKQAVTWENTMNNPEGLVTCGVNEAFIINLGDAVQIGGFVKYRIVE